MMIDPVCSRAVKLICCNHKGDKVVVWVVENSQEIYIRIDGDHSDTRAELTVPMSAEVV